MFHINNVSHKEIMLLIIRPILRKVGAARDVAQKRATCISP